MYPWGNKITDKNAKYDSGDGTVPVGSYAANGFGLYDMAGNVFEWCSDWHDDNYYAASTPRDPQGPALGELRVLRGGSWYYYPGVLRSSYRYWYRPGGRNNVVGFRCAREDSP